MMATNNSIKSLENIFNSQKLIVNNFHGLITEQVILINLIKTLIKKNIDLYGDICFHLLRYMSAKIISVRIQVKF